VETSYGTELIVDEAVDSPFEGKEFGIFGVEGEHFFFDESVPTFSVLKDGVLGGTELILIGF
jgi:hypothetical protein